MKVGLTLAGDHLNADGARFAAQLGVTDVVVHLTGYAAALGPSRTATTQREIREAALALG